MKQLDQSHRTYIENQLHSNSTKIPNTDCTEWKGAETGAATPQIWFEGDEVMARTVGQCVWFIEHNEDLNGTDFYLRNTCGNKGCSNPLHYEKKKYRSPLVVKKEKKVKIIPSLKSKGVFITGSQFAAIKRCPNGYEGEMAKQFRDSGIIVTKAMVDKIKEGKLVI